VPAPAAHLGTEHLITIVGAGPAGCLLGILLAQRGESVQLLERRPDPRLAPPEAGRSINLALAARGIRALREAGVMDQLTPLLTKMRGRLLHEIGVGDQFAAYGQRPEEVIWSVSRSALTLALTTAVAAMPTVQIAFEQQCLDYRSGGRLRLRDLRKQQDYELRAERIIGADGAGSALRQALAIQLGITVKEARLPHDYKELLIPARDGKPQLATDALHIWPRGDFMLIALPNADASFTATLFLRQSADPGTAQPSFAALGSASQIAGFFAEQFPDVPAMISDLGAQFAAHPQGMLGTVYCPKWNDGERLLLIGDAAHAIVPFHGQGMNCAFEDCRVLADLLQQNTAQAFEQFHENRREDCLAIAQMALENYGEMRAAVRSPLFAKQRELALALEREHPARFIPRYSMVMFHDEIPYSVALTRGRIQQQLLTELTAPEATGCADQASELIKARLPELRAATA
jgi:kynurenine 3-monooxygenase